MIGIIHVSTTVSLKLKSLFLNLLVRFSLYMSSHFFLELPINSNYQPWDNRDHCKRFPQTSLSLSYTQEGTIQSILHLRKVID